MSLFSSKQPGAKHRVRLYLLPLIAILLFTNLASLIFQYKEAYADTAQDLRAYNKLVGFKKFCGLDGGGDHYVSKDDFDRVFDTTNGDDGNATSVDGGKEDEGASLIVGYSASSELNGVISCNGAVIDVMTIVMDKFGGGLKPSSEDQAKQWLALLMSDKYTYNEAADIIKKGGDNSNPWFDSKTVKLEEDAWGKFVRNLLQGPINDYAKKMRSIDNATITKLSLNALNYCFNWTSSKPSNAKISYESDKLWGIVPPTGYSMKRLDAEVYNLANYEKGDASPVTGQENAQIRSLKLNFRDQPNYNDDDRWFTLGYASEHMLTGVSKWDQNNDGRFTGGLVSCPDLARNADIFKGNLEKSGDNRVKLSKKAEDATKGDGVESPAVGGENADVGGEADEPSCAATATNPMSWAICPVVNGLGDLVDWLFGSFILPLLKTSPLIVKPGSPIFNVWSGFRVIANIVLIIVFLIMIFGQAIGGGLVDAYTAKKVIPRVVIGAIGINLSIYLSAIMVDITNVIGNGIGLLIVSPFLAAAGESGQEYKPGGLSSVIAVVIILLTIGGVVLAAKNYNITQNGRSNFGRLRKSAFGGVVKTGLSYILLFIGIPVAIAAVSIFVTLILRTGIILLFSVTAPIAIALWILPSTEQYFKKWFNTFLKALMVYPIIVILFAMGDVLAYAFGGNMLNNETPLGINGVIAIFAQFLPLFMIGYAFKIAGGVLGGINETLLKRGKQGSEFIKGNENDYNSMRNRTKRNLGESTARFQDAVSNKGMRAGASRGSRAAGWLARRSGDYELRLARANKEAQERENLLSQTGRDGLRYAGAGWVLKAGEQAPSYLAADGLEDENGVKQALSGTTASHDRYIDSKGREIAEGYYKEGKRRHGGSHAEVGQGLEYTVRKAQTDEDIANYRQSLAQNAIADNWTDKEIKDAHAAAVYPHKDKFSSEWFSTPSVTKDAAGNTVGATWADVTTDRGQLGKYVSEQHKAKRSFDLASMRDQDARALFEGATQIEDQMAAGPMVVSDRDVRTAAQVDELFDVLVQKGQVQFGTEGEVVGVSGVSAATAGVIKAWGKTKQEKGIGTSPVKLADGSYSAEQRYVYSQPQYLADKENARVLHAATPGAAGTRFDEKAFDDGWMPAHSVRTIDVTGDRERSELPRSV